jgi:hypothetical protein
VALALAEAWAWLEAQGLIVPASDQGHGTSYRVLSRRARRFQSEAEFAKYAVARMLPREALHSNDLRSAASKRITRYAQRTLIENSLADSVDFFHLDALSSAVGMKIDFDVTLTEVATALYRILAHLLPGYEAAKSRQLFRHFLNTTAQVEINDKRVQVTLPKRAHNPLLIAAGFSEKSTPIPWWQRLPLHIQFR